MAIKVKSKKIKTDAQRRWLTRQLNDPYVQKAQKEGYRSRAAYKLEELVLKYGLFNRAQVIVDLGAAPGGWTQMAKKIKPKAMIFSLDIQPFDPIEGTHQLIGDITEDQTVDQLYAMLDHKKVDVVLSDMAAPACGIASVDHDRIMNLLDIAFDFALKTLAPKGHFVAKVLKGGTEHVLLTQLKKNFDKVHHFKPKSSRQESSEMYVVALGYKG